MRQPITLALLAFLSGCIFIEEADGRHERRYIGRPAPQPGPPVYRLDCAWLASWNCWDRAVAEAESCAPQTWSGPFAGMLADRGYSCFYPDGSAVFFEDRLTTPLSPFHRWSFTMEEPSGATCGWFVETDTSYTLGTASGVVDVIIDNAGISVICQDGTEWFNPDPASLSACPTAEWDLPGYWTAPDAGGTAFGLFGGTEPMLWSCGW